MTQGDELIQGFRELAERNIEQARTAYGFYLDTVADALRSWSSSPSLDSRFKNVQALASAICKREWRVGICTGKGPRYCQRPTPNRNATEPIRPSAAGDLCSSSTGVRASHG